MEFNRKKVALYLPLGKRGTPWSGIGGAEKRLSYLISHMDNTLYDLKIVIRVFENEGTVIEALNNYISESCEVIFVHSDFKAFIHFRKMKYDYVLYDDCMVKTIPGALGAAIAKSTRILIFVTIYYANWSFTRKWHSIIMRFNGMLSSKVDCLYPSSKRILEGVFKTKAVTVTPCSLPMIQEYIQLGRSTSKERIIAFASRLVEDKNPMLLLEAVNCIRNVIEESNYRVVICGGGPLEKKIQAYISDNELCNIVNFLGPQNMKDILPCAVAFCSLQGTENYPSQSLLEAIACGCFIVATNVGDTHLIVKDSFGEMIDNDVSSLSKALLRVINMTDADIEQTRKSASSFAGEFFNPEKAIRHYERICTD